MSQPRWVNGKFVKGPTKSDFIFSFEGKCHGKNSNFCLAAKKVDNRFFISQYRDFSQCWDAISEEKEDKSASRDMLLSISFSDIKQNADAPVSSEPLDGLHVPTTHYIAILEPDATKQSSFR